MLKLENSIRGLSFSRVAFDLTIQAFKTVLDIPYLTIVVAGGIGGGISMFVLSLLEKIGF